MEALNLGDVRKFENGVIGVVLEESGPYYAVLMIDGSKRMVDKSLSYSIPRLKPEVRSMFNALSDAIIDYDNKKKAASEAYVQSSRACDRLNKLVDRLSSFGQEMNLKDFENAVIRNLGSKYNKICDRGYTFKFKFSAHSLSLQLYYRTQIKKYATPDNTPYVSRNYDDTVNVDTYKESYRKEVENHTCLCLPFVMGEKFSMSYDKKFLSVADKNTIFFNHEVNYCFLDAQLTEEMAAEVAKSIKIQK